MLKKIATDKAPAAIGPYSQGIIVEKMLFSSGQIALDPATGEVVGTTIVEQAEQVMKNLGALSVAIFFNITYSSFPIICNLLQVHQILPSHRSLWHFQ